MRRDEANRRRHTPQARQVVKSSRWLLLRNRNNLKAGRQSRLEELLAANQARLTVYLLKDELKRLWY